MNTCYILSWLQKVRIGWWKRFLLKKYELALLGSKRKLIRNNKMTIKKVFFKNTINRKSCVTV